MSRISKRYLDRAKPALKRYQKAFEAARARDANESDTCVILTDFLADVLGYDKYSEVTTEFAIRSTFCDLAIKVGGRLQYLIEVKSVGTDLKGTHLKQAVDYAANQGVDWVILTNGILWKAYRLKFEKPIQHEEVFSLDILQADVRSATLLEKLYLISKEAGGDSAIATYWQQKEAMSRYVVAQLLLEQPVVPLLRRELRRLYPGVRIEEADLRELLRGEVIKRDCLEGEPAAAAERVLKRQARRRAKKSGAPEVVSEILSSEVLPPVPPLQA
jgi:hypothetical protein